MFSRQPGVVEGGVGGVGSEEVVCQVQDRYCWPGRTSAEQELSPAQS